MLAGDHPAGVRGRDADTSLDVAQKPRRRHVRDGETPRKLAPKATRPQRDLVPLHLRRPRPVAGRGGHPAGRRNTPRR